MTVKSEVQMAMNNLGIWLEKYEVRINVKKNKITDWGKNIPDRYKPGTFSLIMNMATFALFYW